MTRPTPEQVYRAPWRELDEPSDISKETESWEEIFVWTAKETDPARRCLSCLWRSGFSPIVVAQDASGRLVQAWTVEL